MRYYLSISLWVLGLCTALGQEEDKVNPDDLAFPDEYEQIEIDSVLSIRLPADFMEMSDDEEGIHSEYWFGYGENDMSYIVHRAETDELICLRNRAELKEYYIETVRDWKDSEIGMKVKYDSRFIHQGVYQGVFEFEQYDIDDQVTYHNDYRLIQVRDKLYQIGIVQPIATHNKEKNDLFFNSITIAPKFTGEGQYMTCNPLDGLFSKDEPSTAYQQGYFIGTFIGMAICILIPIGLIALVVFLVVRSQKKNKNADADAWNQEH
ncbi:hypothetical protein [Nonlabens xiamenensis]|uniref:hypothetical protein n=1 Tax=Nonlabens xiamenensis TaxID=2341043 RepID=UPI000F614309|nr:hypothetical protein [Nonlabens xiamenensis]